MALLTEQEHKRYLELYLKVLDRTDKEERETMSKDLTPFAADTLQIAKSVGYETLYREFKPLYKEANLIQ